jgi:hypothetical protein
MVLFPSPNNIPKSLFTLSKDLFGAGTFVSILMIGVKGALGTVAKTESIAIQTSRMVAELEVAGFCPPCDGERRVGASYPRADTLSFCQACDSRQAEQNKVSTELDQVSLRHLSIVL